MANENIDVEEMASGGRRISVYASNPTYFVFEPVMGEDNTLKEDEASCEGDKGLNEPNVGYAYRRATAKLQELGFRVSHAPSRQRLIR